MTGRIGDRPLLRSVSLVEFQILRFYSFMDHFLNSWSLGQNFQMIFLFLCLILSFPVFLKDDGPLPNPWKRTGLVCTSPAFCSLFCIFFCLLHLSAPPLDLWGPLISLICVFSVFPKLTPVSSRPGSVLPQAVPLQQCQCPLLCIITPPYNTKLSGLPSKPKIWTANEMLVFSQSKDLGLLLKFSKIHDYIQVC